MKLVPLGDKVVLKQVEAEETTKGGIILAAKAQERPQQATVIAVGDGKIDGKDIVMSVKVGDQVVYSKYAGNEFKLGDEEYILCKMSDILAKVE
jgi:chaperonin GroES